MQTNRLQVTLLLLLMKTLICNHVFGQELPYYRPFTGSPWAISSPVSGAVYQRGNSNTANITVNGSFNSIQSLNFDTGPANLYEISASLKRLDLYGNVMQGMQSINIPITRLKADLNSNTFSGKTAIPGGWYLLTLTASFGPNAGYTTTMKVGVGEVFIIAGQSNAQGLLNQNLNDKVADSPIPTLDAVRVQPDQFDVAKYLVATDPTSIGIAQNSSVRKPYLSPLLSGKEAYNNPRSGIAPLGNSLWYWAAFGERIAQNYNVPVALFNAAYGGTTIRQWQESTDPSATPLGQPTPNGTGRYQPGAPYGYFKNALKFYGATYGVRSVLWLQGETDAKALRDNQWQAQRINSSSEYAQKLTQVINKSREDLKPSVGNLLAWMVGKTSLIEGVWYDAGTSDAQSAVTVRQGQEQVITSGIAKRGPDIDLIKERATGAGEPTHLAGAGLRKAADAWFGALQSSNLLISNPVTVEYLGTEPRTIQADQNGNIITALPSGARYIWYSGNANGSVDLNNPVGYGYTKPSGINNSLLVIEDEWGNYALTQSVASDQVVSNCSVNSPNGSLDYADCNGIYGWAFDQVDLNKTITIDIYVDGNKVGSVSANGDRQDLVGAFGSQAARYHGFSYSFSANASWKNGQTHTISARICGANNDVGSLKTVNGCTGGTQIPTPTIPSGNCAYSEGQYLFTFGTEAMYAHYYSGTLYAAYQDGTNFRPQHWLIATGLMTTDRASCFAENDPHTSTPSTPTTNPTGGCAYAEGQYLFTTSWGEAMFAHYYNNVLFAAYQDGSNFRPQHWLVATGQMTVNVANCFAENDPHSFTPGPTTNPSGSCAYSEGQYLFTFNTEVMYAHYYNGILYAAYQDGSNFRPQHWLVATGLMTTSMASCFAENNPRPSGGRAAWGELEKSVPDEWFTIKLYPNPNDGHFALSTSIPSGQLFSLEIMDTQGHTIMKKELISRGRDTIEQIDLPELALTSVIVRIKSGLNVSHKVLVIRK